MTTRRPPPPLPIPAPISLDPTGEAASRTPIEPTARRPAGWAFAVLCSSATWLSCLVLALLMAAILTRAWGWLDWQFLTSFDSRKPAQAGVLAGLWGSFWTILLTVLFSVPIGIGAAVYLEEYARDGWITWLIRTNLSNLAGVPSVVYGILGMTVFVRMFGIFAHGGIVERMTGHTIDGITLWTTAGGGAVRIPLPFGRTVVSGALTLTLLILPVIIVAAQEALRAIPSSLRHASIALGATRWQTIRNQVLPASLPGILTGVILAISRAIGETAPLVMIGAMTFVYFAPGNVESPAQLISNPSGFVEAPFDTFTTLPIQIYNWVKQTKLDFRHVSAAAILVLLAVLLVMNGVAIFIRQHFSKHLRW